MNINTFKGTVQTFICICIYYIYIICITVKMHKVSILEVKKLDWCEVAKGCWPINRKPSNHPTNTPGLPCAYLLRHAPFSPTRTEPVSRRGDEATTTLSYRPTVDQERWNHTSAPRYVARSTQFLHHTSSKIKGGHFSPVNG